MKSRIIDNHNELRETLDYFNDFHDGFLKSIRCVSGNKFAQNLPWEKKQEYRSVEEKLGDTSLAIVEKMGLFLEIHHYNYDWPNKPPNNRILLYLSSIGKFDPNIVQMVGKGILDCHIDDENPVPNIAFTFDTFDSRLGKYRSHPFEFKKIYIREKTSVVV